MKFFKMTALAFVVSLGCVSCDEIDELTEFDTTFNVSESLQVDVTEGTTTFSESLTLNLAEDDDVADNISAVENVTINSLTYTISNLDGGDEVLLTNVSLSADSVTFSLDDFSPSQVEDQEIMIIDQTNLDFLENILRNRPQTTFTLQATVNNAPVSFTTTLTANVTVTIDAL